MESCRPIEEDVLAEEGNSVVKDLITNKLSTIIEESLHCILCKSLHNVQSGIRSFMINAIEPVMVDKLRKDVIGDALEAHIAK